MGKGVGNVVCSPLWFNPLPHNPDFLTTLAKEAFWKHCGKRWKSWKPAFSPFPTMFSIHSKKNSFFFCFCLVTYTLSYANAFNLDQSKSLSFGIELNISVTEITEVTLLERVSEVTGFREREREREREHAGPVCYIFSFKVLWNWTN